MVNSPFLKCVERTDATDPLRHALEDEEGAGGGGKLKIVPYTVHRLSFGDIKEENVPGLYDGPFPWENMFGFHLSGMIGHDFLKPYAVTFDFQNMQIFLQR